MKDMFELQRKQYMHLSDNIQKLTGNICTSSLKGKIGERYLEESLKTYFPDYIIETTAHQKHQSDIQIITDSKLKILVESKLYSTTVQKKEIDKFVKDLETTQVDYGIFISLTSGIVGCKRFELKKVKNKNIILIPNAGFENNNHLIYAVLFLEQLSKLKIEGISYDCLNIKCMDIYQSLQSLDKISNSLLKIKATCFKLKDNIKIQKNNLIKIIFENEIETKNIIQKFKLDIYSNLDEFTKKNNLNEDKLF